MSSGYLAIRTPAYTLTLSDPDVLISDYRVRTLGFPAPSKTASVESAMRWGVRVAGPWDELAERPIELSCVGVSETAAENSLLRLQRALDAEDAVLEWRSSATSHMIWTTIRTARLQEGSVDKLQRAQGIIRATVVFVTDSEWTGEGVNFISSPVVVSAGDRPARVRLKITSASANSLIGVGFKPDPLPAYDPLDIVASPTAVALTASYVALHTAEVKDTNAHRGQHVVVARVATTAAIAANTRYRAVASVTGSGVPISVIAPKDSRAAQSSAARLTMLPGMVDIPAGGVPDIVTGAGFTAESVQTANATHSGTKTLTSTIAFVDGGAQLHARQTFAAFAGQVTAIEYRVTAAPSVALLGRKLVVTKGTQSSSAFDIPMTVGTHKVTLGTPLSVAAGDVVSFDFHLVAAAQFTVGFAFSNGTYASGALTTSLGTGPSAGDDLTFAVFGRIALGFDSTVTVQGNCSESSRTATLSSVTLLPADNFVAVAERAFTANQGIIIEATDSLRSPAIYVTTAADGTAGPVIAPTFWHGAPRLAVASNHIVIVADGAITISGTYFPCYSNAAAGSL